MLHISLKAEKSFIAQPWPLLSVVGLKLMTGEPLPRYSALQLLGDSGACGFITPRDILKLNRVGHSTRQRNECVKHVLFFKQELSGTHPLAGGRPHG